MFIYLGKFFDEDKYRQHKYKNIVYDTVSKKIDVLDDNWTLLQVAVKLGIMKAVCGTVAFNDLLPLPYRKRYIELDKYVRENTQKYIAHMKVIGKEIRHIDDTFFGNSLPEGLFTMKYFNEITLGVLGGSVEYIFNSSGKFMECRFSGLEYWEFIELVNEYEEESVLWHKIHIYAGYSLYGLIKMLYSMFNSRFRKDFNIGFLKSPKNFRKLELSSAEEFYWGNVVVKFLDGSDKCLLFGDRKKYCEILGDYSFVEIEWLSENIRKKLLERAM
jgi:hypothetical protein